MDKNHKKLLEFSGAKGAKKFDIINPTSGAVIQSLPSDSAAIVQAKIAKISAGFPKWAATKPKSRAKILQKWCDLILQNKLQIAEIMHQESAKLMTECLVEVDYAASFVAEYAKQATVERDEKIKQGKIFYQPIGAVAAITPWNFPAAMITRKVSPALAAGCTVICKPSDSTPLTAIALLNLAREAGLDESVLQIAIGDAKTIGKEFCESKDIKKLSFTGSTAVGKILLEQCAGTVKKTTMELGGNAPFIVLADADLDAAVDAAVKSRFRFSGQTCICANRFLVAEKIYDKFVEKIAAKVAALQIAPLIDLGAAQKVEKLVQGAVKQGARLVEGGKKAKENFFPATVLADVTQKMDIFSEEIFGPVVTVIKFKKPEQAVEMANDTRYGLAAYVFCGKKNKGEEIAKQLNFGMVGVNETAIASAQTPFGGMNESGIGREGSHFGIEEYFEVKFVAI